MKISLEQIKELLIKADNPLFFFDDDPDGLCSYLLLKRYFNKGNGVVIKASPKLDISYLRRVEEYCPDLVVILDQPLIDEEFIEKINVPIIWIDHHPIIDMKGVKYFNPLINDSKDNRPVTYWCYKIVEQDEWIALIGIIGDFCLASVKEFSEKYKDLFPNDLGKPETILFESKFGELVRIFSFILKNRTSEVNKSIRILTRIKDPYEILDKKSPQGSYIYKNYEGVNKNYQELLDKALEIETKGKLMVFTYASSKMSFTADLSNELMYRYPDKIIMVGRIKDDRVKLSLRSSKIKLPELINKSLEDLDGYGGGHDFACGVNINKFDLYKFIENFNKLI
ncbi:MAG: DHHA1 domain-containing protein [archaeon]